MFNRKALIVCFAPMTIMALFLAFHGHAHAIGSIDEVAQQFSDKTRKAFGYFIALICYAGGGSLVLGSLFQLYRHHKGNAAMQHTSIIGILVTLGCGILMLSLPKVIGIGSQSIFSSNTSITGEEQQLKFDE